MNTFQWNVPMMWPKLLVSGFNWHCFHYCFCLFCFSFLMNTVHCGAGTVGLSITIRLWSMVTGHILLIAPKSSDYILKSASVARRMTHFRIRKIRFNIFINFLKRFTESLHPSNLRNDHSRKSNKMFVFKCISLTDVLYTFISSLARAPHSTQNSSRDQIDNPYAAPVFLMFILLFVLDSE